MLSNEKITYNGAGGGGGARAPGCDVRHRRDRRSQDRGVAALVSTVEVDLGCRFLLSGERVCAWCERAACNHPLSVRRVSCSLVIRLSPLAGRNYYGYHFVCR